MALSTKFYSVQRQKYVPLAPTQYAYQVPHKGISTQRLGHKILLYGDWLQFTLPCESESHLFVRWMHLTTI